MKKILSLFLLFVSLYSYSQSPTWEQIKGRFQYQFSRIDSNLRVPRDTIKLSPVDTGSLAQKNGVIYAFEKISGVYKWVAIASDGRIPSVSVVPVTSSNFINATDCPLPDLSQKGLAIFFNDASTFLHDSDWEPLSGGGFRVLLPGFDSRVSTFYFFVYYYFSN